MAIYKVLAPFTGTNMAQYCYCGNCSANNPCDNDNPNCKDCSNCSEHKAGVTGLCCPVDIFGAANKTVVFYYNCNIKSIQITKVESFCATAPPPGYEWVNQGLKVDIYSQNNQVGYVGTVFYGHLRNRTSITKTNLDCNAFPVLGNLGNTDCMCTGTSCATCQSGCGCCNGACCTPCCRCKCYQGIHLHMARSGGETIGRDCNTPVTQNYSIIYQW